MENDRKLQKYALRVCLCVNETKASRGTLMEENNNNPKQKHVTKTRKTTERLNINDI